MRRLFYEITDLDDIVDIVKQLTSYGITDKRFFLLCRDDFARRRKMIHGGTSLEQTKIIAAGQRSNVIACYVTIGFILLSLVVSSITSIISITFLVFCLMAFCLVKAGVMLAGGMYDNYFKGVFDNKLNFGNSIFVVDIKPDESDFVLLLFSRYEDIQLIVDSSTFASPLPMKKYIKQIFENTQSER